MLMVTRTRKSNFVILNNLDYMQYYMMLLEQWKHIVAKDLVTVTWLDEEQNHAC